MPSTEHIAMSAGQLVCCQLWQFGLQQRLQANEQLAMWCQAWRSAETVSPTHAGGNAIVSCSTGEPRSRCGARTRPERERDAARRHCIWGGRACAAVRDAQTAALGRGARAGGAPAAAPRRAAAPDAGRGAARAQTGRRAWHRVAVRTATGPFVRAPSLRSRVARTHHANASDFAMCPVVLICVPEDTGQLQATVFD